MRATAEYRTTSRYAITEAGHLATLQADCCHCQPKMVGAWFECDDCGTVYGVIRGWRQGPPQWDRKPD